MKTTEFKKDCYLHWYAGKDRWWRCKYCKTTEEMKEYLFQLTVEGDGDAFIDYGDQKMPISWVKNMYGYKIPCVYVDGEPISLKEITSERMEEAYKQK